MKNKLSQKEARLKELADKFNALEAEKQEILKECLRVEGEIRMLKTLIEENNGKNSN